MKEIEELNQRLLDEAREVLPEDGLLFRRDDMPDEAEKLPSDLREQVHALREKLNQTIPDDVNYSLALGGDDPWLSIEYENGAMMGSFHEHDWKANESIFDQLRDFDWDAERAWAISGTELFDEMAQRAKQAPRDIPSTKKLQGMCPDEVREFLKASRKDASKVHVLFWQGDDGGAEEFADMDAFKGALPDMMTVDCHIIAVVAKGKPVRVKQIDALKREALKILKESPISHARASGKMPQLLAEMFGEE